MCILPHFFCGFTAKSVRDGFAGRGVGALWVPRGATIDQIRTSYQAAL